MGLQNNNKGWGFFMLRRQQNRPQGQPGLGLFGDVLGLLGGAGNDPQQNPEQFALNLLHGLPGLMNGIAGVVGEQDAHIPRAIGTVLNAADQITRTATNRNVPLERQIIGGLATGVGALAQVIPQDREVTPRITSLLQTAERIADAVTDDSIPLENRIMLSIAHGLKGIGGVTPAEDFVTAEIGKLLVRINAIVKCAVDNNNSDGLKLIQCGGEGTLGVIEFIEKIIQGVDAIKAREAGMTNQHVTITDVTEQATAPTSWVSQGTLMFSRENQVKKLLNKASVETQDAVANAANQTVLNGMDLAYNLAEVISKNLDKDLLVLKVPPHLLAEVFMEITKYDRPEANYAQKVLDALMKVYNKNETLITNVAGLAGTTGAAHMLCSIDYSPETIVALLFLAAVNINPDYQKLVYGAFAAAMTIKDNVLPGALLMLAAWLALVPSLVDKDLLAGMVQSKFQSKAAHPSLRA
jgi:hypothetical protein